MASTGVKRYSLHHDQTAASCYMWKESLCFVPLMETRLFYCFPSQYPKVGSWQLILKKSWAWCHISDWKQSEFYYWNLFVKQQIIFDFYLCQFACIKTVQLTVEYLSHKSLTNWTDRVGDESLLKPQNKKLHIVSLKTLNESLMFRILGGSFSFIIFVMIFLFCKISICASETTLLIVFPKHFFFSFVSFSLCVQLEENWPSVQPKLTFFLLSHMILFTYRCFEKKHLPPWECEE